MHGVILYLPENNTCNVKETVYHDGERWKPDPCQDCVCDNGVERCAQIFCDIPICPPGHYPAVIEGNCCPSCVEGRVNSFHNVKKIQGFSLPKQILLYFINFQIKQPHSPSPQHHQVVGPMRSWNRVVQHVNQPVLIQFLVHVHWFVFWMYANVGVHLWDLLMGHVFTNKSVQQHLVSCQENKRYKVW